VGLAQKVGELLEVSVRRETVAYPGILFGGGGDSTNSVEDRGQKDRENGDLGAVAPSQAFWRQL
jgi:hypothetical protein